MSNLTLLSEDNRSRVLAAVRDMCRIFWGPDAGHCRDMTEGRFLKSLEALAAGCVNRPAFQIDEIRRLITGFEGHRSLFNYLEQEYVRLFINTRKGVRAPLYQSCYENQNASLMGAAARAMTKRLQSKGLDVAADLHEPPDHLAVELEYLYFLLHTGWQAQKGARLREAQQFCAAELLPWLTQLESRLSEERGFCFYPLTVSALIWLIKLLADDAHRKKTPTV